MKTLDAILTRRSTRKYLDKMIEADKLDSILEAGIYAPSGGNNQANHFIVIENKEILNELVTLVQEEFSKMEITEGMYKSLVSSIRQSKQGHYQFFYNAPILIVIANLKDYDNAMADCACAIENMMIMANELDLGSCYINQLKWLNENNHIVDFFKKLGLDDHEKIFGSICLGYPDTKDGKPIRTLLERKGNKITYLK